MDGGSIKPERSRPRMQWKWVLVAIALVQIYFFVSSDRDLRANQFCSVLDGGYRYRAAGMVKKAKLQSMLLSMDLMVKRCSMDDFKNDLFDEYIDDKNLFMDSFDRIYVDVVQGGCKVGDDILNTTMIAMEDSFLIVAEADVAICDKLSESYESSKTNLLFIVALMGFLCLVWLGRLKRFKK